MQFWLILRKQCRARGHVKTVKGIIVTTMRQILGRTLRCTDKSAKGAMSLVGLLVLTTIALTLTACSAESRHRIIIYDQSWSSAAGVKNLLCIPELRASCEREARETEMDFSKRLSTAFHASPQCATVQFLVSSGSDKGSKELEDKLTRNAGSEYWRLRVDFHPRLPKQPCSLGPGNNDALVGCDDAEHDAAFICEAAKHNGVTAIW